MKDIYIGFSGFWKDFDIYNNLIVDILSKHFRVRVFDTHKREEKDKIQYLFYSVFSDEYLEFNCIRIFYTGENLIPDFNLCDYAMGFSHLEFGDRYIRFPIYCWYEKAWNIVNSNDYKNSSEKRDKFCAMVVSAPYCQENYRTYFFNELSEKYKKVDSGGRYLNNIGKPEGVEDKLEFLRNYKFSFAFENVSYPGYCTEKIVESFATGTIPIYWGDPNIENYFNFRAFVNCHRYKTVDEIIQKIKEIDNNDYLYREMLNEHPIKNAEINGKQAYEKRIEDWFESIFSQDYKDAFRRNRYGIGKKYEKKRIPQNSCIFIDKITKKMKKILNNSMRAGD